MTRRLMAVPILLLTAASAAFAEPGTTEFQTIGDKAIDRTTQTEDIKFRDDGYDRMTVPVRLQGTGPYRFLVDTGADRTAISSDLATRLKLYTGDQLQLHSVGKVATVSTASITALRLTRREVRVDDAAVLESRDMGADGILGVDSLSSERVLFDFEGQTMSIVPSSNRENFDRNEIVITARRRNGRLVLTQARANDRPVAVVLDTGAQISVGNAALRKQLVGNRAVDPNSMIQLTTVTGEIINGECVFIDRLKLGDVDLKNVGVVFADAPAFKKLDLEKKPAMLLGMNAMRAFDRISIDFSTKKVRFVLPGTSMREPVRLAAAGSI